MPTELHVDFETRSRVDIRKAGSARYARDPSTQIIVSAWAIDDEPVLRAEGFPDALRDLLLDKSLLKIAHNAAFERDVLEQRYGIYCPPEEWHCTMAHALSRGLPAALGQLAKVMLPDSRQKMASGTRLIRLFSCPQADGGFYDKTTHPDDWSEFLDYGETDVWVTRDIFRRLAKWPLTPQEHKDWCIDQRINARGLPVDRPFVAAALDVYEQAYSDDFRALRGITGCADPAKPRQFDAWLQDQGVYLPDLQHATFEKALAQDLDPDTRRALELSGGLKQGSTSKLNTMLEATTEDDWRVRGCFQFAGAGRTGRTAGRLIQPQNLSRCKIHLPKHDEVGALTEARRIVAERDYETARFMYPMMDLLASMVRPAITAPEGKKLVVSDYSSIESVMAAWAAGGEYLLGLFRAGRDPYRDFATHFYGVAYEDTDKDMRTRCKPASLGCQYGLGKKGLQAYADSFGVSLTLEESDRMVQTYREVYSDIPAFWRVMWDAALETLRTGRATKAGAFTFYLSKPYLVMELPSGRCLYYTRPAIEMRETPWGDIRPSITYEGVDQYTKQWTRLHTHPGHLFENAIQAIANDVLREGLRRAVRQLEVVGHVHDEIIALADERDDHALPSLDRLMSAPYDWCPDAPIRSAGFEAKHYRKD